MATGRGADVAVGSDVEDNCDDCDDSSESDGEDTAGGLAMGGVVGRVRVGDSPLVGRERVRALVTPGVLSSFWSLLPLLFMGEAEVSMDRSG